MIQAIGLTGGSREGRRPAVDDLSFEAPAGRITVLLGDEGAGKTTALRLMLQLESGRGVALFRGRPLHRVPNPAREIGVVLGDVPGHPGRTARGHLRMLSAAAGVPASRADDVLDVVGLSGLADEKLGAFSRGMDRRLGLAAALLGDPHTLLLDEPSRDVSPREAAWLHGLLQGYAAQGGAVLVTSSDARAAARLGHRVVTVEDGRLVADQTATDFARTRLRPRVVVRSPHADRLASLLVDEAQRARPGAGPQGGCAVEVVRESGSRIAVYGSSCAAVGDTAFRHGILVHRLADEVGDTGPVTPLDRADGRARNRAVPAAADPAAEGAIAQSPAVQSPVPQDSAAHDSAAQHPAVQSPATSAAAAASGDTALDVVETCDAAGAAEATAASRAPADPTAPGRPEMHASSAASTAAAAAPASTPAAVSAAPATVSAASAVAPTAPPGPDGATPSAYVLPSPASTPADLRSAPSGPASTPADLRSAPTGPAPTPADPRSALAVSTQAGPDPASAPPALPHSNSSPLPASPPHGSSFDPTSTSSTFKPLKPLRTSLSPGSPGPAPASPEDAARKLVSLRLSGRGPEWPLRYEFRRATTDPAGPLVIVLALAVALVFALVLARAGDTSRVHVLTGWPRQLPFPPVALAAGLIGALSFGQEFRYPALAPEQGTVPRRLGLLAAKLLVSGGAAVLLAVGTLLLDGVAVHGLFGSAGLPPGGDVKVLAVSWAALLTGCAWAGVLAAGVFRSTATGMAVVLAVPVLVLPLVQHALAAPAARSLAGVPARLRSAALVQWPSGFDQAVEVVLRLAAQPVGGALSLSITALVLAYALTALRRRAR
ncbi:ATP-binding cassette domain-containing protein [Streptomyces paromomycinus]|uniref:ABC transporter n=1 Tax=Streptomyces paromomycinus TaxID=92743 RepID=A0A401VZQ6_STREY|nr:ATP-binding cassette domain-containing protein [Streptomyces paromomycinus]GCD42511.1 ABC transporter [Streptomyces paromomycinus]